jgi:hypothetical protein
MWCCVGEFQNLQTLQGHYAYQDGVWIFKDVFRVDLVKPSIWSLGYVSALDCEGLTIWIADAHRGDGKRHVVQADELLTAFVELQRAICVHLLTEQV